MADIKSTPEAADLAVDEMHDFGSWMLVKTGQSSVSQIFRNFSSSSFGSNLQNKILVPNISPSVITPDISSARDIIGKRDLISSALPTPILNTCAPVSVACEVSQIQAENEGNRGGFSTGGATSSRCDPGSLVDGERRRANN
ncbi:benzoate 4-monooxygenase cytochrome P450 [Corchorus olitorius]|uniref:Benzoate 4-monooxygenase cytochrome P450 n=1 Tax=Corchorus olitorius TaxID=93759 RepID=A0A1R3H0Y8_9ROSI|nr:benzoate 4-monooxygenase cytochrome P450 [Corchorus olitorius]